MLRSSVNGGYGLCRAAAVIVVAASIKIVLECWEPASDLVCVTSRGTRANVPPRLSMTGDLAASLFIPAPAYER